jgi:predicted ribosome quality control (RQC) complex YloA/Tae2 family protein
MALDGVFLSVTKSEFEQVLINSRIDKIHQPSKEEIVITFRFPGGSKKVLINAGANSPRVHFTNISLENPKTPPMFCMLLRKHLGSGRLLSIKQLGLDRVLYFNFQTVNDLGDYTTSTLAIEIMGRHSNVILLNENNKVIDSIKRVNNEMSAVRQLLPGIIYEQPPIQDKLNIFEASNQDIIRKISEYKNCELSKALLGVIQGTSPLLCREIAHYVTRGKEVYKDDLTQDQIERLGFFISNIRENIKDNTNKITMVLDKENKPFDFSFLDINQYGSFMITKNFEDTSSLLDSFYCERDRIDRMKQRSSDLLKLLINKIERTTRKIDLQVVELEECANREELKIKGDLITSNLHLMQKGQNKISLQNYYDNLSEIEISLDERLTPSQNAQKYYNDYRKLAVAEKKLKTLIEESKLEIIYLESVYDSVCRTGNDTELLEIKQELSEQGYIKNYKNKYKQLKALPPMKYISSDGFTILCGRNNLQNDKLTLKVAKKHDLWFHTQNIPGSHVVVITDGVDKNEIPDKTLNEALMISAYNSNARNSAQVAVDYTEIKNIKKPNGAKPGMVIFENYYTGYTTPVEEQIEKLKKVF